MKTLEEIQLILKEHLPELREHYDVIAIAVFGSVARGDQTAASDVDILVELRQPVGWEIIHLQQRLEEILGLKADLVTRNVGRSQLHSAPVWSGGSNGECRAAPNLVTCLDFDQCMHYNVVNACILSGLELRP